MERPIALATLFALLICSGCGKQPNAPPASAAAKTPSAVRPAGNDGPSLAVGEFLEAVRAGNDAKAAQMLTPVARARTAELQMVVAPPGSPTAKFTVNEVEMIGDDGADVSSTWSDVDDEGNRHSDEILWILRHENEGWRVAGMATKIFDDEMPIILNFEDPQDMIRKQKLAEEEVSRAPNAKRQLPAPIRAPVKKNSAKKLLAIARFLVVMA